MPKELEHVLAAVLIGTGLTLVLALPPTWRPDMPQYLVNVGLILGAIFIVVGIALLVVGACRYAADHPVCLEVIARWESAWTGKRVASAVAAALLAALTVPLFISKKPDKEHYPTVVSNDQKGGQTGASITNNGSVYNGPVTAVMPDDGPGEFTEDTGGVPTITLGCMRFVFMSKEALSGHDFPILSFVHSDGRKDIAISGYIDNGVTKVNIRLNSPIGGDLFSLQRGHLSISGKGWQVNYNKNTLEVVNEEATPVIQMIRPNKREVILLGYIELYKIVWWIMPIDGIIPPAYDADGSFKPSQGYLRRIFKYPVAQYKGIMTDNMLPNIANCKTRGTSGMGSGLEIPLRD